MPEIQQVLFEWGDPGDATSAVLYIGKATIGVGVDDPGWEIRKFFYDVIGGKAQVSEIKTLNGKAWSARAGLSW